MPGGDGGEAVVYIDRLYADDYDTYDVDEQPWLRQRRFNPSEPEWTATTGGTAEIDEESGFDTVDDAIAWARERADIVLVRLGADAEAVYSAGRRPARWSTDDSSWPFPPWPPKSWPDYTGPPEPGWPEFYAPDDD
jgi:hypothetical protein